MSPKTILAVAGANDDCEAVFSLSARLALYFGAYLEGFHVRPATAPEIPSIPRDIPPGYRDGVRDLMLARGAETEQLQRARFWDICKDLRLAIAGAPRPGDDPSASWHVHAGDPRYCVAEHGRVFDLIVLPPLPNGGEPTERYVENALIASGRPVLIVRPNAALTPPASAVVAWNRGVYAARALGAALPFLSRCPRILIVHVETGAKFGPSPEEASSYLAWHGIPATVDRLPAGPRGVGELLLQRVAKHGANLLVMGASYHSRVSELLVGGVTRYVLRHAEVPLLLTH